MFLFLFLFLHMQIGTWLDPWLTAGEMEWSGVDWRGWSEVEWNEDKRVDVDMNQLDL
jgi:hypothetical protein